MFLNENFSITDYRYNEVKLYLFTFLFSIGNLALPLIVHYFGLGGPVFLPIYFFILIGSYKFGLKLGLMTAVITPIINHLATGMPNAAMIYPVFVKGIALALIAYAVAGRTRKISIQNLIIIILSYQAVGIIFEAFYFSSLSRAFSNFAVAYPGMLIQLVIGYLILRGLKDYGRETTAGNTQ